MHHTKLAKNSIFFLEISSADTYELSPGAPQLRRHNRILVVLWKSVKLELISMNLMEAKKCATDESKRCRETLYVSTEVGKSEHLEIYAV
jgi:hypothetical protein